MKWIKKRELDSIEKIIESNTGMTIKELTAPKRNPYIKNLKGAVDMVRDLIKRRIPIKIMADYDCDGVMAGTIMYLALKTAGAIVSVRFPRRFSEGYGLSMKVIDETPSGTAIITVDNGIAAVEQVAAAKKKNITVIVTDHHLKREDGVLPDADIIVDPNALEGSEFNDYCGAALAYRFALELIPGDKLINPLCVFAGIATVADVMPLTGDNRNLVIDSLQLIERRDVTLGMKALLNALNLVYANEGDYGFKLGPIVNASGRLFDDGPMNVFNLLSVTDYPSDQIPFIYEMQLQSMAEELIAVNKKRQEMVKEAMVEVYKIIKENDLANKKPIIVYSPHFSEGIIGIIAGHVAEEYRTPAIAFTDSSTDGIYKGSARTYGNVHLKHLLDKVSDKICGYGGHAGAAGLSVKAEMLDEFTRGLEYHLKDVDFDEDRNTLYYDLEISSAEVPAVITELKKYAPFGEGNPQLVFKVTDFECILDGKDFYRLMGTAKNHIRFNGKDISAVGFDMSKEYFQAGSPKHMDFIGYLSSSYFNGKFDNQIEIIDFKKKDVSRKTDFCKSLEDLLVF